MQNNQKAKVKSGLLLTVMCALVILSSFSISVIAQSQVDSKKDVVITEAQPPKDLNHQEFSMNQQDSQTEMVFPVNMTQEQAYPFIKAAEEVFKAKDIRLPESGYWISSKYINNASKDIQIDWYPDSFSGIGPMNNINDKVYFVYFTNADLDKGTGVVQNVDVIEKGGIPYASSSTL